MTIEWMNGRMDGWRTLWQNPVTFVLAAYNHSKCECMCLCACVCINNRYMRMCEYKYSCLRGHCCTINSGLLVLLTFVCYYNYFLFVICCSVAFGVFFFGSSPVTLSLLHADCWGLLSSLLVSSVWAFYFYFYPMLLHCSLTFVKCKSQQKMLAANHEKLLKIFLQSRHSC